jgi:Asp-tRNA(Asn)/Glu-tRNA(Gln) amidotransferase A subunit family amidase
MNQKPVVLLVNPHPDDESLGAGGLLAAVHDAGGTAVVLTCTNGEHGFHEHSTIEDPEELIRVRIEEQSAAAEVLERTVATLSRHGGVVTELQGEGYEPGVRRVFDDALARLERLGAKVVEVSLPHAGYGLPAYYLIAPSEASSNLARFDGVRFGRREERATMGDTYDATRTAGFGAEVKRRIMLGTYALSAGYYDAYYGKAQKVRTLIIRDFENLPYDLYKTYVGTSTPIVDATGNKFYLSLNGDLFLYLGGTGEEHRHYLYTLSRDSTG